jgi:positive regulator of sigma E activity
MNEIDHDGIVEEIVKNRLMVRIVTKSACVSCQVKNLCNPSEMQEKVFKIDVPDSDLFSVGDRVKLAISERQGLLAVFLGYGIPFMLLLGGIIIGASAGLSELASAGLALGMAGLYYLILFFMQKKTMRRFTFQVTRL